MGVTAVGVPLITPVPLFSVNPAGSAGLTPYAATAPPLFVGVSGFTATPLV
jgi:hypothetical protein